MRHRRAVPPPRLRRGRHTAYVLAFAMLVQVASWGMGATATPASAELLVASAAPPDGSTAEPLGPSALASARAEAVAAWAAVGGDASGVSVSLADLPGLTLGSTSGSSVVIDAEAAGWGWSAVGGALDLGTAVRHELGHALGLEHSSGLMGSTLSPGEAQGVPPGLLPEPEPVVTPESVVTPEPVVEAPAAVQVAAEPAPSPTAGDPVTPEPATGDAATGTPVAPPAAPAEATSETSDAAGMSETQERASSVEAAPAADPLTPAAQATLAAVAVEVDEATTAPESVPSPLEIGSAPTTVDGSPTPEGWSLAGTVLTVVTPDAGGDLVVRVDPATGAVEVVDATGVVHVLADSVTAVAVVGGSGDDRLTVLGAGGLPVTLSYDGGAGHDELVGPAQPDVAWSVTGDGSGSVAGVTFTGLEDLTGAAGNRDTFVLGPASTVPGRLEGGDGGFDVLVVEGSYTSLVFDAMGPDNGTVTADGNVIRYDGLEPISVPVQAAVMVITASTDPDDLVLEVDEGTGSWVIRSQNGTIESHSFAAPSTSLTIVLGDGDDSLTIGDLGVGATVITVTGGAGADTITVADVAGTWTLVGVDAGTHAASGRPTVLYASVESLVGAETKAETWVFAPLSGTSGGITDGTGDLTVVLGGVLEVTGDLDFVVDAAYEGVDTAGTEVVGTAVTVSGTTGTAFFGLSPLGSRIGLEGAGGAFDLAVITQGSQVWQAATGTFGSPAFVGLGSDLVLDGTQVVTLSANLASLDRRALDFVAGPLVGLTARTAGVSARVDDVVLSIGDLLYATGDLVLELGTGLRVDVETSGLDGAAADDLAAAVTAAAAAQAADGVTRTVALDGTTVTNLVVDHLSLGVLDARVFAGTNPAGLALLEQDALTVAQLEALGATGLYVGDADLGLVLASASDDRLDALLPGFSAGGAAVGSFLPVGLPAGFTLHLQDIALAVNSGGAVTGDADSSAWIDWSTLPGGGLTVGDVLVEASTPVVQVSAGSVLLDLGFVVVTGSFVFEHGGTSDVQVVVDGDALEALTTVRTTTIGIGSASVFAGTRGSFTPAHGGWDCDALAARGAVGLCGAGVDLGLVLASAADLDLPTFFALAGTSNDFTPVGLPDGYVLRFTGLEVTVNRGGVVGGTGPQAGLEAHVDWSALPDGGLAIGDVVVDAADAVVGLTAASVFLDLDGFVSLQGSFSYTQGGPKEVQVVVDGAALPTTTAVTTTIIGIGAASVFAGSPGSFEAGVAGWVCAELAADGAVGLCASGVNVGIVLAKATNTTLGLPTFLALSGSIDDFRPVGLPSGVVLAFETLEVVVNAGGAVAGRAGSSAHVDWSDSPLVVGEVQIDAADAVLGLSAQSVLLTVGGFLAVQGSFAFVQGVTATVAVRVAGLLPDALADFETAAGTDFAGGLLSGVDVVTTTITIGDASVFAGSAPGAFTADDAIDCDDLTGAAGVCAAGIDVGLVLAGLVDPDRVSGFTLPAFTAAKVTIADLDPLGLPEGFILGFDGIELSINRGGVLKQGATAQAGSNAWIDWEESFPASTGVAAGLELGDTHIDMADAVLAVSAETVLLNVGDFLVVRGSFSVVQGELKTVAVRVSGLSSAERTALANAAGGDLVDGLLMVEVSTTTIGIGDALVFAGYHPGGFADDAVTDLTCAGLVDAVGFCAEAIDVAVVLARVTDTGGVSGYVLPRFTAAKIQVGNLDFLGLPSELEVDFEGLALTVNRGGALTKTTGAAVGTAWVDWGASFPKGAEPAGLPVDTGAARPVYLDLRDPVLGLSADAVILTIDDFVSIRGSFAFSQGGLVDLVVGAPTLSQADLDALAASVDGAVRVDDQLLVEDVQTTAVGIGGANVYVGYAHGGFDALGAPVDATGFYGVQALDIDLGLVVAKTARTATGRHLLPTFVGLTAEIGDLRFAGIPTDILELYLRGVTFDYNSAGAVTGFVGAPKAYADWSTSVDSAGTEGGVAVPTDSQGGFVVISHETGLVGVAAAEAVLGIGDFVRVTGAFSFQLGAERRVTLGTAGLNAAEFSALQDLAADGITVTGTAAKAQLQGVVVRTTLIGLADAAVFIGYNPDGFADGEAVDCTDLAGTDEEPGAAFGFCLDDVQLGLVLAQALPSQLGALVAPKVTALRASLGSFIPFENLLGIPDFSEWLDLELQGLELVVNKAGRLGGSIGGTAWIDWADSFPAAGADAVPGLLVPTGGQPVLIDFDSPVLGASADFVRVTIGDFVHVSGGFAFTTGGLETVKVDVRSATLGPQVLSGVVVKTTTFGISNASVFVGHEPAGISLGADVVGTAAREDWLLERTDLSPEATGLLLSDIDLGIVFATAKAVPGRRLPTFTALKAHVGDFVPVNLLPDFLGFDLRDIGVLLNRGGAATGPVAGPATLDWSSSFAAPGYEIRTSTTNDEPLYVDFRGPVIGVSAGLAVLSISEFVHVSGGFSFLKGETLTVDVNSNLSATALAAAITLGNVPAAEGAAGVMWRDGAVLRNVLVDTIQLGIRDASLFLGYNPLALPAPDATPPVKRTFDLGEDDPDTAGVDESRVLGPEDLSDEAVGLFASDVDFGMVLATIVKAPSLSGLGATLPRFIGLSATVEQFDALGFDEFVTIALRRARVEVNYAGKFSSPLAAGAAIGPAIDWTTQTYDDDESDSTAEVTGGYGIATGGENPDVVLRMSNYLIGGGADLLVLGLGEFVHLRGAAYFEMGETLDVPLVGVVDASALTVLGPTVTPYVGAGGTKQLRFLTFGGEDLYAFVGVGGPHWVTTDGNLLSDVLFECDPTQPDSDCVDSAADGTGGSCGTDSDRTDGFAAAEGDSRCSAAARDGAVGIAVSDLDFAFAMGTPVLQADPTRYYTLRARIDQAALVGLENDGLVASLRGVVLEVNVTTPTVGAFPILPVIDWKAHALTKGCTAAALETFAAGGALASGCEPFGVRTGRIVDGVDVREYFLYDGLYVRAAVRLAQIDVFGVLVARGSLAFELGGVKDVTLVGGTETVRVTTMTIGGANLFGFVGSGGPHWVEDPVTKQILYTDTGLKTGTPCTAGSTGCKLVENTAAVGIKVSDLDFGLFVGAKLDPQAPAAYVAANISLGGLGTVNIPGVTMTGLLALSLNLGFALSGSTSTSVAGINFATSFSHVGPGGAQVPGFQLDTGDPNSPMLLDFTTTFLQVQLAGSVEIRAGPAATDPKIVRIDGIFFLGVDLDAGAEEFRLLALGQMTIGPDIGSADPLLDIGAIGVLVLNDDGVAGDFTVNLTAGGPIATELTLAVKARVVFNTAGKDMTLELPSELSAYLTDLGTSAVEGVTNPGALADVLLRRLTACGDNLCYTIDGRSPVLVTSDAVPVPDEGSIGWLLGKAGATPTFSATAAPYVVAVLDGRLTVVGFASAQVFGAIRIAGNEFDLIADLDFRLGTSNEVALQVEVKAIAKLSSAGFYLDASVLVDATLLQVFDLFLNGRVTVDTRGTTSSFQLVLNGSVTILNVVTVSGGVVIKVGGALGADAWYFGADLGASFGPLSLRGEGFISSWGSFSFTVSGGVDLTFAGTGIQGSLTAHVSYCARDSAFVQTCNDDIREDLTDGVLTQARIDLIRSYETASGPLDENGRTFLAALNGRVAVKIIGITLAGVQVGVQVAGSLGGTVQVRATFTVETIFGDIERTVTIATFRLPGQLVNGDLPPPYLASSSTGVLTLNVGSLADQRAESLRGETDEEYTIRETATRGTVIVSAFGWTETHTGITSIVGDFGDGRDSFTTYPSVTATVNVSGGGGDDHLAHAGGGLATLYGNGGDDTLIGGQGADVLDGGTGSDFLDGGAGLDVMRGGDGDDTFFGFGHLLAGETVDPGTGYDRMEVVGRDTGETITLDNVAGALQLDYDGSGPGTPLVLTGIDELLLRLSGGDALTVQGDVETLLTVLTITSAPYRAQHIATKADVDAGLAKAIGDVVVTELVSSDRITLVLDDSAADTVLISSDRVAAPATFSKGDGIFQVVTGVGDLVDTTTVAWTSAGFLFTIANTGQAANDRDLLTITTGGGDDDVVVRSLLTDLTLQLGAGDDDVVVGSAATCVAGTCTNVGGHVDDVRAPLTVTAGTGADRIDLSDAGDTTANELLVTAAVVQGLGMHASGIAYSGVEQLDVRLGSGNDTVQVRSTSATTSLQAFGGNDVFWVSSDAPVNLGSLDLIVEDLTLAGGDGNDTARFSDRGDVTGDTGTQTSTSLTGFSQAVITYSGFEELDLDLGSGVDTITVTLTEAAVVRIEGTEGADLITLVSAPVNGNVTINGQGGDDRILVLRNDGTLTVDGGQGSDSTEISLSSTGDARTDVRDSGTIGTNRLVVWGSDGGDQVLLRRQLVALLNTLVDGRYTHAELVSYAGIDSLVLNTLGGADHVAFDDVTAATTVNGGAGADTFQVGQLYSDACTTPAACFDPRFAAPTLVDTTQGQVSNGISQATTVNGGEGEDLFLVFRNKAVLTLNGENGDDTFVIRTFLEEDSETQLSAGEGADSISYVMNAPVSINGGDGYDSLFVIGTEADDAFVVTASGVYGAGRFVSFVAVELLVVDAAEGDDRITVVSTAAGVLVEVYGGLGSDLVDVGGDAAPVAADDLTGHSGLVVHSVEAGSALAGRPLDGIAAEVADEDAPGVVLTQTGGSTVVRESTGTADSYTVVLTRAPTTDVRVTVTAAELTPDQALAGMQGVQLSLDGITWVSAVEVLFTSGSWSTSREIQVRAVQDAAAEGAETTTLQHSVRGQLSGDVATTGLQTLTVSSTPFGSVDVVGRQLVLTSGAAAGQSLSITGRSGSTLTLSGAWTTTPGAGDRWQVRGIGEYDELAVPVVGVLVVDDDVSELVLTPVDAVVGEAGDVGSYTVELSAAPSAGTTVTVARSSDVCLSAQADVVATADCGGLTLTFTPDAFGPVTVHVTARPDSLVEGLEQVVLQHQVDGAPAGLVSVLVTDDDVLDLLVVESDGSTHVTEDGPQDSYTVSLTRDPLSTVTVTAAAAATTTQYAPAAGPRVTLDETQVELSLNGRDWSSSVSLVFTSSNWQTGIVVQVRAKADQVVDGSIVQAFPARANRVNALQGTLTTSGGQSTQGYSLAAFVPVVLPTEETGGPLTLTPNSSFDVIEAHQVDTLVVDDSGSVASGASTLTATALTGLGMGVGGLAYSGFEDLRVLLGSGVDALTIETTHRGTTTVDAGGGADAVEVRTIAGHTRVLGGAGDDTVTVGNSGLLSGLDAQLLVSGGDGNDTTFVRDTADTQDDHGALTRTSLVGLDMVSGTAKDLYSVELAGSLTGIVVTVTATRAADLLSPGFTVTAAVTLTQAELAGMTAAQLAVRLQAALFPVQPLEAIGADADGDGDRYPQTGCGTDGTTGEADSRCASSVYGWDSGSVWLLGFRGELAGLDVTFAVTPVAGGTATDLLRRDGLTYDGLEVLDIALGSGHDRFDVRGTLPTTRLGTGAGDDVVLISDAAFSLGLDDVPAGRDLVALHEAVLHGRLVEDDRVFEGTLDDVDGALHVDTGAGSNTLAVSDHASTTADTAFVLTNASLTGLATGGIAYTSTGGDLAGQGFWALQSDTGMFGRGVTVHLGAGDDAGRIDSVRGGTADADFDATVTTVYGGAGAERITVTAPHVAAALLVVHGDAGDDVVDGSKAGLGLHLFGDSGFDVLSSGSGADVLIGDDGRVSFLLPQAARGFDVVLGGDPTGIAHLDGIAAAAGATVLRDGSFTTADVVRTWAPTVGSSTTGRGDVLRGGAGRDLLLGGPGDDRLDGGADDDVVVGDNAVLLATGSDLRPRFRTTGTLHDPVASDLQADPNAADRFPLFLYLTDTDGNDVAAGGAGHDLVFGGQGADQLHGDGVTLTLAGGGGFGTGTADGDDYLEGGPGSDTLFGGLGQDDLVGGSSALFGLVDPALRADGADLLWGGNGDLGGRNDVTSGHARDADVLLGDNGNVYRVVKDGAFDRFTYDTGVDGWVVPRMTELLDYTETGDAGYWYVAPASSTYVWKAGTGTNVGGGDALHGESGDDVLHGLTGADALFGDGGDDDLYGEAGSDWLSGGTGDDGLHGDDGRLTTSRNGLTERLHGITTPNLQDVLTMNGDKQSVVVFATGELLKVAEYPGATFSVGGNDVMYGGWGNDFLHGGQGDDAMSGAEAAAEYYVLDPLALLTDRYTAVYSAQQGYDATRGVLQWGTLRPERFVEYEPADPRRLVTVLTSAVPFLLVNQATENAASGGDGKDVLFGDGGNDWLVGGTGHDRLFGGWGNDLLDADDDPRTNGGLNDAVDAPPAGASYSDIAYGGAGMDVLIGNTASDRLYDWNGEFNSYLVPFNPFGAATIHRSPSPALGVHLSAIGRAGGADVTLCPQSTCARGSEPYGELGMVQQGDADWGAQHGAPTDPQPGNGSGKRDAVVAPATSTVVAPTLATVAPTTLVLASATAPTTTTTTTTPTTTTTTTTPTTTTPTTATTTTTTNTTTTAKKRLLLQVRATATQPVPALTAGALARVGAAAVARAVADGGPRARLAGVRFVLADLPDGVLAEVVAGIVAVDRDAAGAGWFADPTPATVEEFVLTPAGRLVARDRSAAAGRVDLLSVLLHELGHVLGHEHERTGVMAPALAAGERRTSHRQRPLGVRRAA